MCTQANKLDDGPSNSFLTFFTCLQCSDNGFGGGNVSRDVLYERGGKVNLIIPSAIKIVSEVMNVYCSGMTSFKSLI